MTYDDSLSLRDARALYFEANGFGSDGGYLKEWVELPLGPFTIPIPNTESRRRAVRYHDLHHLLTGYGTDWQGEFEISAWEIAGSCRDFAAAWVLNLGGLAGGVLVWPRAVWRAFLRGRHSRNLYAEGEWDEARLERSVGHMRAELGLDAPLPVARLRDLLAFAGWATLALAVHVTALAAPIAALVLAVRALL